MLKDGSIFYHCHALSSQLVFDKKIVNIILISVNSLFYVYNCNENLLREKIH